MSLFKSVTKSIGNVFARPVHAVASLAKGDVKQAYKDIKNAASGGMLEVLKREAGISTDKMLALEAAALGGAGALSGSAAGIAATQGLSSGGLLGESGILGSLFGGLSSIGSGISGLGSALLSGIGDYFNLAQQWKYQKQAMDLQDQFNKEAEARQFEYNRQMMWKQDYMNQRAENRAMQNNIQLWNMQNEYNTPAAQMQRLTDAGLNPNLAYGSANTTAGSITSPGTGSVSSHGVSTRATKALVRQAMSLNYQQIVSNQLQNAMMAEQIADRRANRTLAIEQHPLDMAYKQAQIDAIRNGIDIRGGELGISGANLILSQEKARFDREKLAWDKYQDDLKNYYAHESEIPVSATLMKKFLPRAYNNFMGRRPMWMDYDHYYRK